MVISVRSVTSYFMWCYNKTRWDEIWNPFSECFKITITVHMDRYLCFNKNKIIKNISLGILHITKGPHKLLLQISSFFLLKHGFGSTTYIVEILASFITDLYQWKKKKKISLGSSKLTEKVIHTFFLLQNVSNISKPKKKYRICWSLPVLECGGCIRVNF